MLLFSLTARRWKRQADRSLAPTLIREERRALARRLALRFGRHLNLPLAQIVDAVAPHLDDFAVRSALAARYLDALAQRSTLAEYEEAKILERELRWAEHYLEAGLNCPFLARTSALGSAPQPDIRQEQVQRALAEILIARLELDIDHTPSAAA